MYGSHSNTFELLNLNLIQTSTYYNMCCTIPFHVILFAYWITCNILSAISTHLSYWHDVHLEFIMPLFIIFCIDNSLSVDSLEFTLHYHVCAHRHLYHVKPSGYCCLTLLCLIC